ncbi:porin [Reichenbachiella agarivorans]|uniref:Porin n=1 Tax=Reichenbachiella agarivorans TaxID=2979464 RepID=A0ABY6CT36_9BACT|nr:porin [Reichenbachiella agarivorans]UXP33681.1 porin [Reichenbachiella agarivorans]
MNKLQRIFSTIMMCTVCYIPTHLIAQDSEEQTSPLSISAFVDTYYSYDFDRPTQGYRQSFFYNHNRHNEFNINLALIRMAMETDRYHAVVTLQAGTYPQDNYSAEQDLLQHLHEAYAGVALTQSGNLWLDAGVFASNLGFESAMSIDNYTLTRCLISEESPYYLSGAKLTYTPSDKWSFLVLASNGWQHIQRIPGNSLVSMGSQIQFMPNDNILLNWSTFIGTDDPDTTRRMRYFNDFFGTFKLSDKLNLIAGVDVGWQQTAIGSDSYDSWVAPVVIAHYQIDDQWGTALRGEYFNDSHEVAVPTGTGLGFKTTSVSWNLDYQPDPKVMCRVEGRYFSSPDDIFNNGEEFSNSNFFITASLAVKIGKQL